MRKEEEKKEEMKIWMEIAKQKDWEWRLKLKEN